LRFTNQRGDLPQGLPFETPHGLGEGPEAPLINVYPNGMKSKYHYEENALCGAQWLAEKEDSGRRLLS
jgi:hypothetical protein